MGSNAAIAKRSSKRRSHFYTTIMLKKHRVVMLPAQKQSMLVEIDRLYLRSLAINDIAKSGDNRNIYILSDEEPVVGDYCMTFIFGHPEGISQVPADDLKTYLLNWHSGSCRKVILTSDVKDLPIPGIPIQFLKEFVEDYFYHKTEFVMVEYELMYKNKRFGGCWQPFPDESPEHEKKHVLKVNHPLNMGVVELCQSSWNKSEVKSIVNKAIYDYIGSHGNIVDANLKIPKSWFDKNL